MRWNLQSRCLQTPPGAQEPRVVDDTNGTKRSSTAERVNNQMRAAADKSPEAFALTARETPTALDSSSRSGHGELFTRINDVEIYYGTMFGSAEQFARSLAQEIIAQRDVRVAVHDLDGFEETTFALERLEPSRLFVFVVSTHFAGSPSPSTDRFHGWISDMVVHPRTVSFKASEQRVVSPPDRGCLPLFRALSKDVPGSLRRRPQFLKSMRYAVFGIGDSAYQTFNAVGKFVDSKLYELGAVRLLPIGLGDCSNDVHSTYMAWEASVLQKLPARKSSTILNGVRRASATVVRRLSQPGVAVAPSSLMSTGEVDKSASRVQSFTNELKWLSSSLSRYGSTKVAAPPAPPSLQVRDNFGKEITLGFHCIDQRDAGDLREHLTASPAPALTDARRSTSSLSSRPRTPRVALFDEKPFAEIVPVERVGSASSARVSGIFKVRLLNPETSYTAMKTLAVFPHNSPDQVESVAAAFNYDLDTVIELFADPIQRDGRAEQQQLPFPSPCTIRTVLTELVELRTVSREFVSVASGFVASHFDKRVLDELVATDRCFYADRRALIDLIAMAPTLQIPLAVFVNIVKPIKPRYFTIASSPRISPRELDIAISLGRDDTSRGLATSFAARILDSRDRTPVPLRGFICVSRFQFKDDGVAPMVFIASGVGFTVMRALIQDRLAQWLLNPQDHAVPKHLLFLGAANDDSIVFRQDLRYWEQQLVVKVHLAFSDDQRHAKRYVQDLVASRVEEIVQLVNSSRGSRIFICGRAAMVSRIRELFEADQRTRGSRWFDQLHKSGHFIEEGYK